MQDSPQQRVVDLKRHCRQIYEGVSTAKRSVSIANGKVSTETFGLSRCRQKVRAVQAGRLALEAALMGSEPLVEGCLVEVRTVCGKASCRCKTSKRFRHGPYLHLSLLRKGKTRMIHLPKQWEEEAKTGVEAARRFRKARRQWRALQKQMEDLWRQVERNRKHLPYEPKKKSR